MKNVILSLLAVMGLGVVGDLLYKHAAAGPSDSSVGKAMPTTASSAIVATDLGASPSNPGASTYKDGTYSATGSYVSPDGPERIGISLTVAGDKVSSIAVTPATSDPQSLEYQNRFASGISSIVDGKPLSSSFDVSSVNGSSLTGTGFTQALAAIRAQAAS